MMREMANLLAWFGLSVLATNFAAVLAAFFTVAVFVAAYFGVGGPSFKGFAGGGQIDIHFFAGFQIGGSCGAKFCTVGKVNFDSDSVEGLFGGVLDSTDEGVAVGKRFDSCHPSHVWSGQRRRQFGRRKNCLVQ